MALRTSAKNAEDVAAGFTAFRAPIPEHTAEITGLISDLYSISSLLTNLDELTNEPRYRRGTSRAESDLELVQTSLKYTFEDIVDFFGRLDGGDASREVFKRTWQVMGRFFWDESHYALVTRLAKYRTFLRELGDVVKDKNHDSHLLARFRGDIKTLLATQDQRLAPQLGHMSLGRNPSSSGASAEPSSPISDRRPRRRSFERIRPPHLSPQSPQSPSSFDIPPHVPDAPSSPLTGSTTATTTATSQSANADAIQHHWAKQVFSCSDTDTPIPYARERSNCYGDPNPGAKQWLREHEFEELLQLAFSDDTELRVTFYLRERDHRVRLLCRKFHRNRPSDYFCLPLNMLEINRDGSCLRLCRRRRSGTELVPWANLKFTSIETLVLFFCTFLALRSQDAGRPVENIRDFELSYEQQFYGGQIIDDDYRHALRIYRDTASGAVRLQASVHQGDMKGTPVWTTFITLHLGTRGWLRRRDARTVLVRHLALAILMSAEDYTPPQTPQGEHILKFTTSSDADVFLDVMDELTALTLD